MPDLDYQIKVMTAARDGEEIEVVSVVSPLSSWRDKDPKHNFDWICSNYRIKEKPLEFWVIVESNGSIGTYETKEEACQSSTPETIKLAKVREVTE